MNVYGDFSNFPNTETRKKNCFEKKQFEDFSGSKIVQKSILGIKNNCNDYIISITIFSKKKKMSNNIKFICGISSEFI